MTENIVLIAMLLLKNSENDFNFNLAFFDEEDNFVGMSGWEIYEMQVFAGTKFRILYGRRNNNNLDTYSIENMSIIQSSVENPNIIDRNKDIECSVQANAHYGFNSGSWNTNKYFSILIGTDVHGDRQRTLNLVEYLNNLNELDCGIILGDLQGSHYSDNDGSWLSSALNKSGKPIYLAIGNHDGGNGTSSSQNGTKQQQFDKYFFPNLQEMGLTSLTKTYYSVNYNTQKVTMIVLDCYDAPDTNDGSGNFIVSREKNGRLQSSTNKLVYFCFGRCSK